MFGMTKFSWGNVDKVIEELRRGQKELQAAQRETDRQMQEGNRELRQAIKKTMQSIDKTNGNFNNKWGAFLEALVEGDLVRLLRQRGVAVSKIKPRVKYLRPDNSIGSEYDLVAVGDCKVVVFEVKTTLNSKSLDTFMDKLQEFGKHFTEYSDKKIYAGIAYMRAEQGSDDLAMDNGLFLIKAPGGASNVSTLINPQNFVPRAF